MLYSVCDIFWSLFDVLDCRNPQLFVREQEHSQRYHTIFSSYGLVSRNTRNESHAGPAPVECVHGRAAYFNETIGIGPTRQLAQHNTFKGHLLSYLFGSPDRVYRLQAQQRPVILAP